MAYKPYFESYNFQEGLLDAAEYALNAGKKKIDAFRAKGAQKEMGSDAVKLFQKEPKEIIQLALAKYNKDYQKAYNYLKTISQYDLADHEDEMENAKETLGMMRNAIMKVFKFDPEKKSNQKFGGGRSSFDLYDSEDDEEIEIKGRKWDNIAKNYMKLFYNRNPEKAFNALRDRIRDGVKSGEFKKGDRDYKNAVEALRAIKNKVDKENADYDLSKEKQKPAQAKAPAETPKEAAQPAAPAAQPTPDAKQQVIAQLKANPIFAAEPGLLKTREKQINALSDEKMAELVKAINANPKELVKTVTSFVQQKPGQ